MADQPPGVTVTDNPDGTTQTIHASAVLHAAVVTTDPEEEA